MHRIQSCTEKLQQAQELPLSLPRNRTEHCFNVSSGLVTGKREKEANNRLNVIPQVITQENNYIQTSKE